MRKGEQYFIKFSVLAILFCFTAFSFAADYPTKPIECLIAWGPSSTSAISVKVVTDAMSKLLGKPILLVTAAGAGGMVAGMRCASAKPDGYTLLGAQSATNGTALHTRNNVKYKNSDFEFLAQYCSTELGLIVKADSPIKNLKDFIAYAKKNNVTFAYQGVGVGQHIVMELLKLKVGGLKISYVPVVSAFDLRLSVIGGHTDAAIIMGGGGGPGDEFKQTLESGGRIIAVANKARLKNYPDIPTFTENGMDIVYQTWLGIAAPKGMPREVSQKLKDVLYKVISDPQTAKNIENLGYNFEFRKSEEFTKYVQDFENLIEKVVKEAKIPKT